MTKTGTIAFSAPEIFLYKEYDNKIDIWSAGIIMFIMLSGTQPFTSENVSTLIKLITENSSEPNYEHKAFNFVTS